MQKHESLLVSAEVFFEFMFEEGHNHPNASADELTRLANDYGARRRRPPEGGVPAPVDREPPLSCGGGPRALTQEEQEPNATKIHA